MLHFLLQIRLVSDILKLQKNTLPMPPPRQTFFCPKISETFLQKEGPGLISLAENEAQAFDIQCLQLWEKLIVTLSLRLVTAEIPETPLLQHRIQHLHHQQVLQDRIDEAHSSSQGLQPWQQQYQQPHSA